MESERMVGDRRCWPCTLANSVVGLGIAWIPPAAMLLADNRTAVPVATAWGLVVTTYTAYRLVGHGALPLAERTARRTGLHDRIGPETRPGQAEREDRPETDRRPEDSTERE